MADDGDRDETGPEPTQMAQISRVGLGETTSLCISAAVMCLCGPVMLGFAVLTGAELMVMGIVFTVVFVPLGLGLCGNAVVEREHNRRLDAVGVPATAEITDLTDFDWSGEESGVTVGLRVSGPGLRTFETTWKRTHHPALRVGLRLPAVVDPSGGRFRVEF
ncbi:hypothetical protein OG609_02000 [Streptomyces sp. NBC_01224]|uniref:hypothetical protein n=1 Tax=unclassified Streptomyces TaxID=2593676 RepID=UPI002E129A44|nr:hypothetical protein OG609_02000 [Streptomyces sp. NBC_01224]